MDLQYFGGNCLVLSSKGVRLVIDDNLAELGMKTVTKDGDVAVFTGAHGVPKPAVKLLVDGPGEYEVSGMSIIGIAARGHMDVEGTQHATMYKVVTDDANYLITGHIYPELSDAQLEAIGMVDVMLVPVGGSGYTLDPIGALQLIKKVEPKVAVPTHYDDGATKYPVPQLSLEQALKGLSMEVKQTLPKLHFKLADAVGDTTQLIVLERN